MVYYLSVPLQRLEEGLDFLVRGEFHAEVRMADVDHLMSLSDRSLRRLGELLADRSLEVLTHGPFFGLDIASLDRKVSDYTYNSLTRALEASAILGSRLMVVHTGFIPQFSRGGRRHWFSNWGTRMPRVLERARELGVEIVLENTWEDHPEVIRHLMDLLPAGEVGVCMDTGHINVFSHLPLARWWKVLGERVLALHLHDNDGLSDDHLRPGRGTFDFPLLVKYLKDRNPMPLMDLEIEMRDAREGRLYLEGLFEKGEP